MREAEREQGMELLSFIEILRFAWFMMDVSKCLNIFLSYWQNKSIIWHLCLLHFLTRALRLKIVKCLLTPPPVILKPKFKWQQGPFFLLPNHNSTLDRKKKIKFLSITLKTPYTAEELGLKWGTKHHHPQITLFF